MRRISAVFMIICLMFATASCGEQKQAEQTEDDGTYEVAVIVDSKNIDDGAFNESLWECVSSFCEKKNLTCMYYTSEKNDDEIYASNIQTAVDSGAGIVIFAGSDFETAAYDAQEKYPDTSFLIIDGMPHDKKNNYEIFSNTTGIVFAEEEAGFLAGYSAVKDGYTKLGFMGGKETPPVKRYGYGFVQGADTAADELGVKNKISVRYEYTGTYDESDDVKKTAAAWYSEGTQVIFACGGAMGKSVINAAEASGGKVIGADVDQSSISDTVITSAEKDITSAVENVLRDYAADNFTGGTAFNYAAKNDGVKLEMKNSRFSNFDEEDYSRIFKQLENGSIDIRKDTDVKSVTELAGEHTEIKE